ncbi:MAG: GNAT family N-acetyltransferase [Planctomycetes bacterium]|nr:GNAT family N-acetyltransferase [Planctomycetota bacterium]
MRVEAVSIDQIRPLRHEVLRKSQPFETTLYSEDLQPGAEHFGAFTDAGDLAAIASIYAESRPEAPSQAWRLRGMASSEALRGKGYGSAVLRGVIESARSRGIAEIWCNARVVAFEFYQRHGFQLVGELFEIEGIGPHSVMVLSFPKE